MSEPNILTIHTSAVTFMGRECKIHFLIHYCPMTLLICDFSPCKQGPILAEKEEIIVVYVLEIHSSILTLWIRYQPGHQWSQFSHDADLVLLYSTRIILVFPVVPHSRVYRFFSSQKDQGYLQIS